MNFDEAFKVLIDHEGGFQRSPKDRGNWTSGIIGQGELKGTKFGIAAHAYPFLDIKNLTLEHAKRIYQADYWAVLQLDRLPASIRFDLFDMAVNSGVKASARVLQKAVKAVPDGVIGPKTVASCILLDPQLLDKRFNGQRLLYLAELDPWPTFGKGWVVRVANNLIKD